MGLEQNLTSEVIMAHEALPDSISVKYTSDCTGGENPSDRGKCDNVNIGKEVSEISSNDHKDHLRKCRCKSWFIILANLAKAILYDFVNNLTLTIILSGGF